MTHHSISEFISTFPEPTQIILENIRELIIQQVPEAQEAMVYGIPTFKLNNKNLVHFSGFTNHIGFYPTPSAILAFKSELSKYKTAKGSVQFPINHPIPYELITKIVEFRVKQVLNNERSYPKTETKDLKS